MIHRRQHAILTLADGGWLEAHRVAGGWRVDHYAKRWGGQQWEWKPVSAARPTVEEAVAAVYVALERGSFYGIAALGRELAARARTLDPAPA